MPACYADAAAAYGRAFFAFDTALAMTETYFKQDTGDLTLANEFLADARADRELFERLMAAAEPQCP